MYSVFPEEKPLRVTPLRRRFPCLQWPPSHQTSPRTNSRPCPAPCSSCTPTAHALFPSRAPPAVQRVSTYYCDSCILRLHSTLSDTLFEFIPCITPTTVQTSLKVQYRLGISLYSHRYVMNVTVIQERCVEDKKAEEGRRGKYPRDTR